MCGGLSVNDLGQADRPAGPEHLALPGPIRYQRWWKVARLHAPGRLSLWDRKLYRMLRKSGSLIGQKGRSVARELSEADLVSFCSEILPDEPMYRRLVNEARFGLSRVLPLLSSLHCDNPQVLEVGAGSCLLSAYLASRNVRITALEPLRPEFDFFTDVQKRVLDFCRCRGISLEVLRETGEQLDILDRFGVAFTINALEHMRDPLLTLDNMYRSLAPGGALLAHCPNYTVPFDPHFNILLVTRSKPINAWLSRSKIQKYLSVWEELNFIRYIDVRRHLGRRGSRFTFNTSVLRDSVERLLDDPTFAERMPLPVRAMGGLLHSTRLVHLLGLIPARWQTPMEVLVRKP
jgi:SAM-dependent methyltransferase